MSATETGTDLLASYDTERLKTLSAWSCFAEEDLRFRPAPRARTPLEQMVHQCVSEDIWMRTMLGIEIALPALPAREDRLAFLHHYAEASEERRVRLADKEDGWWAGTTRFFDVERSRAWVFVRRLTHSAHHRGQLTVYLRLLGRPVYSTYGPTADTGGLFLHKAPTLYRYASLEDLLAAEDAGGQWPELPGPGEKPATERP
ncbi:MAG TPA: damage-inducible protein DinB [Acidobacteria bacterium]|nr:damage-inducible protein DinB [Acidobacteriota bacterium]